MCIKGMAKEKTKEEGGVARRKLKARTKEGRVGRKTGRRSWEEEGRRRRETEGLQGSAVERNKLGEFLRRQV